MYIGFEVNYKLAILLCVFLGHAQTLNSAQPDKTVLLSSKVNSSAVSWLYSCVGQLGSGIAIK